MTDNSSKQIILSALGIAILVVAVIGVSFAAFTFTGAGTKENTISTGTINMTYTEDTNGISITNALPTIDANGKVLSGENEYFDFTVTTTISGDATVNYEISAIKDSNSTLTDDQVKLYLEKKKAGTYTSVLEPTTYLPKEEKTKTGTPAGSMVLYSESNTETITDNYRLRMWLADTATEYENKYYTVKVNIYGKAF